ncbi:hypothetical protein CROQUDRAFT_59217 [Cronartium quercuum f. sp. fusiforme G11]|uniref:Ribosomal RNA-processing protein 8 n=1 Tax=Cronartium quercuum f. sp. fusiforme G11 TaxID=708437 RepID=A0A9P6TF19_9BASI|nr:hypothetical protein CROQUDRAFT_59217 [Cronartium quercuum f. sp. fusiforme G11]
MPSNSSNHTGFLFETPGWSLIPSSTVARPRNKPKKNRKPKKSKAHPSPSDSPTNQASKSPELAVPSTRPEPQKTNPGNSSAHSIVQNLLSSSLSGSRFRVLNETLYTSTGPEAAQLFSNELPSTDPNPNFVAYHQGFRKQTKHWPQNPVNVIATALRTEYGDRDGRETVMVADLGCGEAPLAKIFPVFRVMGYDLVADREGWVVAAECSTKVPLPGCQADSVQNAAMDVVVCCLSLMGTNWVGIILEARRILKHGGQLKIAEVTSRFVDVEKFIDFIKLIGFSTPTQDNSNTHFILFNFKKIVRSNPTQLKMNRLYDEPNELKHLILRGEKLLKPCIYKRR